MNAPIRSRLELAVDAFLLDYESRRLTPKTLLYYRQQLNALLTYLNAEGVPDLKGITGRHLRGYFVSLQNRGLADHSIHDAARAVRAWCNFLVREEMLDKTPMANVKMPRLDKDILPGFSADDVHKLLDAAKNPRHREVVLALIDTGCRAQEFINLNVGDVDIKTGTVKIRQGKGRNDRVTFLGAKSRRLVLKWLMSREAPKPEDPLWTSDNTGERLTYWGLSLLLRRLGKAAQVENCHPHTFRRTCALWNLRSGMNVYALQQIMGHGSLEILRKYLALAEQDLVEAHRKHGAVDNVL